MKTGETIALLLDTIYQELKAEAYNKNVSMAVIEEIFEKYITAFNAQKESPP